MQLQKVPPPGDDVIAHCMAAATATAICLHKCLATIATDKGGDVWAVWLAPDGDDVIDVWNQPWVLKH